MKQTDLAWSLSSPRAYDWADWDRLNRTNLPLLDSETVKLLLAHFGTGVEAIAVCRRGAAVVAAAIIARYKSVAWQTWQPPQHPLALWVHDESIALPELMRSFVATQRCAMLSVTHLDPRFHPRPNDIETLDCMQTAYVPVTGDFSTYWSARHNLKANLKKQRSKMTRDGIRPRMEAVREADKMRAAVTAYGEMEARGWKGAGAVRPDNAQGKFYAELLESLARRGEATVYRYLFNDKLVASDLCVHRNGVVVVLKTTYDETENKLSPALLLKEEMLQEFFKDERTTRVEWYGPLMDWHRRWSDQTTIRALYDARWYRWSWLGSLVRERRRLQAHRSGQVRDQKVADDPDRGQRVRLPNRQH